MRRTKIIATLGPATDDPDVLASLIDAGADVVRLNFSHGSPDEREARVAAVRKTAAELGRDVGVLGDLQGPKIRIRRFADGSTRLEEGQTFFLDADLEPQAGTSEGVGVAYEGLASDVVPGDILLLDDGHIELKVEDIRGRRVNCSVVVGGELGDRKGINRRGGGLSAPALSDKDREDLKAAAGLGIDWLAVSFVRDAEDILDARRALRNEGGQAHIVAKIERTEAVANLNGVIDASDAVMVARGDLGVETGYAGLTGLQKKIIRMTRERHKVAITATQMMESMVNSQMPTRAEVSDVSNAVIDGTDAVMLSAETAIGDYPVKAVAAMSEVCEGAEQYHRSVGRTNHRIDDRFRRIDEAIAMAVMYTANHMDVEAIIALTESGSTALWMSRIRSDIPIFAFTRHEVSRRRVTLYRGVYPIGFDVTHSDIRQLDKDVFRILLDLGHVREGDLVIFTRGDLQGVAGGTNDMKIVPVTGG